MPKNDIAGRKSGALFGDAIQTFMVWTAVPENWLKTTEKALVDTINHFIEMINEKDFECVDLYDF
ncbi:hypothetical protein [Propionispira raffinosivorans]|uniref:hypothetical protein n=1 Tax=Propionispira raffinosivorans TaxID=86959 RepID=UPI0003828195|nr:hypothetical protein [Propionispira raffinosivorans]